MKGVKECENCQELIEKDMKFCPHCGAEVKREEMPQECEDILQRVMYRKVLKWKRQQKK